MFMQLCKNEARHLIYLPQASHQQFDLIDCTSAIRLDALLCTLQICQRAEEGTKYVLRWSWPSVHIWFTYWLVGVSLEDLVWNPQLDFKALLRQERKKTNRQREGRLRRNLAVLIRSFQETPLTWNAEWCNCLYCTAYHRSCATTLATLLVFAASVAVL